jgi:hypothetical protein
MPNARNAREFRAVGCDGKFEEIKKLLDEGLREEKRFSCVSLEFDKDPSMQDNNDYSILAPVAGTQLKIFFKTSQLNPKRNHRDWIQTELRPEKNESGASWMIGHFRKLGYSGLRNDHVFLPAAWKSGNMASNVEEAARRSILLVEIALAETRADLSGAALALLSEK